MQTITFYRDDGTALVAWDVPLEAKLRTVTGNHGEVAAITIETEDWIYGGVGVNAFSYFDIVVNEEA